MSGGYSEGWRSKGKYQEVRTECQNKKYHSQRRGEHSVFYGTSVNKIVTHSHVGISSLVLNIRDV